MFQSNPATTLHPKRTEGGFIWKLSSLLSTPLLLKLKARRGEFNRGLNLNKLFLSLFFKQPPSIEIPSRANVPPTTSGHR